MIQLMRIRDVYQNNSMYRLQRIIQYLFFGIVLGISVYLFVEKYRMGMFRYFDMDEMAYLNWTAHMVQGALPYKDFSFIVTPGFLFLLAPLFWWGGSLLFPLYGGRIVAFLVFVLLCLVMSILFFIMRKRWTAIFVVFLLVFLPMPADKFIEIRPDTTAILFAMLGTVFQVLWMQHTSAKRTRTFLFLSGVSFVISLAVMQKTFLHVAVSAVMVLVWAFIQVRKSDRFSFRLFVQTVSPFVLGGCVIGLPLLLWGISLINIDTLWYSLIKLPMELRNMGKVYAIPPLYYFHYIDLYYGISGRNWGFLLNHGLWIFGLTIGAIRFIWSLVHIHKKEMLTEFLISTLFVIQILAFLFVMPFKHAQYLIPMAVFVVFYVVDGIDLFWTYAKQSIHTLMIFVLCISLFLLLCIRGYHDSNDVKYTWTNAANQGDITMLQTLLRTIPRSEYVYDMIGLSLYYPQPYFASCVPVGQISQYLTRPFPPLIPALIRTDTKYIYQGNVKRTSTLLWEDQQYILSHFTGVLDGSLLVRNDIVSSYNQH